MTENFNLSRYISDGYELFKKSPGTFIGFVMLSSFLMIAVNIIPILGLLFLWTFASAFAAGFYIAGHNLQRNATHTFGDFFEGFQKFVPFLVFSLISGFIGIVLILVLGGMAMMPLLMGRGMQDFSSINFLPLILMVVCLLAFFLFLIYAPCYILFKNQDAIQAMKSSFDLVKQNIGGHLLMMVAFIGIMIVAALPLGVGLLVAVPLYYLTIYSAWRHLSGYNEYKLEDHLI